MTFLEADHHLWLTVFPPSLHSSLSLEGRAWYKPSHLELRAPNLPFSVCCSIAGLCANYCLLQKETFLLRVQWCPDLRAQKAVGDWFLLCSSRQTATDAHLNNASVHQTSISSNLTKSQNGEEEWAQIFFFLPCKTNLSFAKSSSGLDVCFGVTLELGEVDWGMKKVLRYQEETVRKAIAT